MDRRFFKNYIKKNMRRIFRSFVIFSSLSLVFIVIAIAGVFGAYYYVQPSLPKAETIREIPLETPLKIYTRDGRLIDEIGDANQILKEKFGEDVIIKKFEKSKGWLSQKLSSSSNQVDQIASILDERSIWQRYGF